MIRIHPLSGGALAVAAVALTAGGFVTGASAQIVTVDPFVGDGSETFEEAAPGFHDALDIFFIEPESSGGDPAGQLVPAFITTFSTFMGSTVVAHTGNLFSHMTGPVDFTFNDPVRSFGGYFATNSGSDGGIVEFYDGEDDLIDIVPLDVTFQTGIAPYTWNGWTSDVPFSRVNIRSNGVIEGFLGFDDVEMSFMPVPAPGAILMFLVSAAGWRRAGRQ